MGSIGNIEIILKKNNGKFRASCTAFPKCKGIASTENEAILKLSESVSRFISKSIQKVFKSIIMSDNYTEILLDTTQKKEKPQKRVFSLDPSILNIQKTFSIKASSVPEPTIGDPHTDYDLYRLQSDTIPITDSHPPIFSVLGKVNQQQPEEFLFGFPISFN